MDTGRTWHWSRRGAGLGRQGMNGRWRRIQLGMALGLGLALLLLVGLQVGVRAVPPAAPAPAPQAQLATVYMTATVGTSPTTCGNQTTLQVRARTRVYFCVQLQNPGPNTYDQQQIAVQVLPSRRVETRTSDQALEPNPGVVVPVNLIPPIIYTTTITDTTGIITWTARSSAGGTETRVAQVQLDTVSPAITSQTTVGQNRNICPSTTAVRVLPGQSIAYCVTVRNSGDITLTTHSLLASPSGPSGAFFRVLPPSATMVITPGTTFTQVTSTPFNFEQFNVQQPLTTSVRVSSTTAGGLSVTSVSTATVGIGNVTVRFTKTVGTDPRACPTTQNLTAPKGSRLYYCAWIQNTGRVPLTRHRLLENDLSIDVVFNQPLAPGAVLTVTNEVLARYRQPQVFGPFEFNDFYPFVVNHVMYYTGWTEDGLQVDSSSSTSANFPPTPTPTNTRAPRATDTPTPWPTSTPTETPWPMTPTDTPSPTFTPETPTATPTRSYAISSLATPTPGQPVFGAQTTLDPFYVQATQMAETATAMAMGIFGETPTPDPFATPTPDPFAQPTPDPFALPTPDPFAVSPLPEPPTPDPFQGGSLPVEEPPIPEPPTATPEFLPTDTPAALVMVVTNTPAAEAEPAGQEAALPPGQRPIVYPTPTPTPDTLMIVATIVDGAALTLSWIWLLLGILVFFVTAGIFAGLYFRESERRRYQLYELDDADDGASPEPAATPSASRRLPPAAP
jgi:hypothetical protein